MRARAIACTSLLASALVLMPGCRHRDSSAQPPASPTCPNGCVTLTAAPPSGPAPAIGGAPDVASLVANVKPAVVNITTTQEVDAPRIPFFRDWPFGDLFKEFGLPSPRDGDDERSRLKRQALGSGFIVDARGYVVTNAHVVDRADKVRVRLADERELDAKVKGRDERLDLAVLEIEGAKDLPTVVLGSSEAVRVGDYVIAIGNPFGLGHTVTMGIVSAKSREIGAGPYDDFIQTDASINPGNSGGPLFNTRGEVIGVATAINPNGKGIGFAIPVDALKEVLPQLIEKGHVARGRLGVHIQEVDESLAKALGLDRGKGALVADVEHGSAGEKAGLRPGDVIVSFEGQEVTHSRDLPRMVARKAPGSRVKLEVMRDGKKQTFEVTLDTLTDEARKAPETKDDAAPKAGEAPLGLELTDDADRVIVRRVKPGSPAEGVLQRGDVILEIDKKPVKRAHQALEELRARKRGPVMFRIERHGVTRFVAIDR